MHVFAIKCVQVAQWKNKKWLLWRIVSCCSLGKGLSFDVAGRWSRPHIAHADYRDAQLPRLWWRTCDFNLAWAALKLLKPVKLTNSVFGWQNASGLSLIRSPRDALIMRNCEKWPADGNSSWPVKMSLRSRNRKCWSRNMLWHAWESEGCLLNQNMPVCARMLWMVAEMKSAINSSLS